MTANINSLTNDNLIEILYLVDDPCKTTRVCRHFRQMSVGDVAVERVFFKIKSILDESRYTQFIRRYPSNEKNYKTLTNLLLKQKKCLDSLIKIALCPTSTLHGYRSLYDIFKASDMHMYPYKGLLATRCKENELLLQKLEQYNLFLTFTKSCNTSSYPIDALQDRVNRLVQKHGFVTPLTWHESHQWIFQSHQLIFANSLDAKQKVDFFNCVAQNHLGTQLFQSLKDDNLLKFFKDLDFQFQPEVPQELIEHSDLERIILPSPEALNFHVFKLPKLREIRFYKQKSLPTQYCHYPLAERTFKTMILSRLDLIDTPVKPLNLEEDNRDPRFAALSILFLALIIWGIYRDPSSMFEGM